MRSTERGREHRIAALLVGITTSCGFPDERAEPEGVAESALGTALAFQDGVAPSAAYAGTYETELREASPAATYGSADVVTADRDTPAGSGKSAVGLLRFDLRSIPPGSRVASVALTVDVTNATGAAGSVLYPARRAWSSVRATWLEADAGIRWQAAGARGSGDRGSTPLGSLSPRALGRHEVPLDPAGIAAVQGWVEAPATNFGFVIDGSNTDGIGFASSEATLASRRPRLTVTLAPACPTTRDPALWPFAPSSPWNRPLGADARLVAVSSPGFSSTAGGTLNVTAWSHPVSIARPTDPVRSITRAGAPCATVRVSASATPDAEADGHLHLVDPDRTFVVETFGARRLPSGDLDAKACVVNRLADEGVYAGWHGTRAYGGSAIGGLIRKGELGSRIPHALAVGVRRTAMNRNTPNGRGFVWPASAADRGWETTYGTSGNLHMGSLLAIPASIDVGTLGLSAAAQRVAKAAQDHGVYVVDAAGANMVFYAEPAAAAEVPSSLGAELDAIVARLRIVTSNAAGATAGGGAPRACTAPPLP